eukprot:TRINITY_DN488_c0_g1_i4.p1 TRINITY_DN488_c0_g1~~TRINITY_DN488_c0_g1_i4.p1  ORF type:complete len:389 (+),score=54.44 TRINITY_DN488_c0_g1_i4:36-1202(+)
MSALSLQSATHFKFSAFNHHDRFPTFQFRNADYRQCPKSLLIKSDKLARIALQEVYARTAAQNAFKITAELKQDVFPRPNSKMVSEELDVPVFNPDSSVVSTSFWNWEGYKIRYQSAGNGGPALVLIHGFGANCDHWRKNIPILAKSHRVYAIDLLGYGFSDKPKPEGFNGSIYTFETWAKQVNDFCTDVVKDQAFLICNSIGGIVGLQAALMGTHACRGLVLLNLSLRMLHTRKQSWYQKPLVKAFQNVLRNTNLGNVFFKAVATPQAVKSILSQCYYNKEEVTDELVEKILLPGLEPGATEVFISFICYSEGPLPEDLIPKVQCPLLLAWGDKDPWEPIELGREYGKFKNVEDFVVFPNVGHCPQDEAPHLVNPLVEAFISRHAKD